MVTKKLLPPRPEAKPQEKPLKAKATYQTFDQFYAKWHAKYAEHGNWPTRIEAMKATWEAAKGK